MLSFRQKISRKVEEVDHWDFGNLTFFWLALPPKPSVYRRTCLLYTLRTAAVMGSSIIMSARFLCVASLGGKLPKKMLSQLFSAISPLSIGFSKLLNWWRRPGSLQRPIFLFQSLWFRLPISISCPDPMVIHPSNSAREKSCLVVWRKKCIVCRL